MSVADLIQWLRAMPQNDRVSVCVFKGGKLIEAVPVARVLRGLEKDVWVECHLD